MNFKIALVASALTLGMAGCMTPTASAPPVAVTTASVFVPTAASSNLFEIESSQLALRRARDPEGEILSFIASTYEAGANLGKWDRGSLEMRKAG